MMLFSWIIIEHVISVWEPSILYREAKKKKRNDVVQIIILEHILSNERIWRFFSRKKMQRNGVRRAHSLWCKSLTHNLPHHPSIDKFQGRDYCSTSNSCKWVLSFLFLLDVEGIFHSYTLLLSFSDDKSFGKESFPWKRHSRKVSQRQLLFWNSTVSGTLWEPKHFHTFSNDKVISWSINISKMINLFLKKVSYSYSSEAP